jgi:hypothetical protein
MTEQEDPSEALAYAVLSALTSMRDHVNAGSPISFSALLTLADAAEVLQAVANAVNPALVREAAE